MPVFGVIRETAGMFAAAVHVLDRAGREIASELIVPLDERSIFVNNQ